MRSIVCGHVCRNRRKVAVCAGSLFFGLGWSGVDLHAAGIAVFVSYDAADANPVDGLRSILPGSRSETGTLRAAVCDNCPDVANADQADSDGDGVGGACQGPAEQAPPAACGCGATTAVLMSLWVMGMIRLARRRSAKR